MGYTTDFQGRFDLDKPLTEEHAEFLTDNTGYYYDWRESTNKSLPPAPGAYCQWVPTKDLQGIEWDGEEKFYKFIPWLQYLVTNCFEPWGYKLNGTVIWRGEEFEDMGRIEVTNNVLTVTELVPGIHR